MKYPSVLCIEDDLLTSRLLKNYLEARNIIVHQAMDLGTAYAKLSEFSPDLIVLDLTLPTGSSLEHIDKMRTLSEAPIIVYTSNESQNVELKSLQLNVDDFVIKSRGIKILYNRILKYIDNSQEKRTIRSELNNKLAVVNNISIDSSKNTLTYKGKNYLLTKSESHILYYLFSNYQETVTRDEFSFLIKGYTFDGWTRSFDLQIFRLRKKLVKILGEDLKISTVRGKGYRLISGKKDE
ncbi:response regulator transcription factor [Vibrio splendidus]|uniref:response regulator transcription factor n=1 Tax=Vibrio splendidus TaxID=29497 RepID=UPI000D337B65|nr:response regulator transcription factor [Vibrio splendidus]PTP50608.1 hypothetical protein CWO05_19865 [Vibrio splendidus]